MADREGAEGGQGEPGGARGSQEETGGARGSHEEPGGARGSQEQEEPEGARRGQGEPGGARGAGGPRTHTYGHIFLAKCQAPQEVAGRQDHFCT